jgi:mannitol-1-phosphate/altronate dehydrogenase
MVDRIVPAVTAETLDKIEQLTGVRDPAGVACEPFRQWVIEDNFVPVVRSGKKPALSWCRTCCPLKR